MVTAASWLLLLSAPLAWGLQVNDKSTEQAGQESLVVGDEVSATFQAEDTGAQLAGRQAAGGVSLLEHGMGPSLDSVGQGGESVVAGSNRHLFSSGRFDPKDPAKQRVLDKVARAIETDQRGFFAQLNRSERVKLAKQVADHGDTSFVDVVAPPSLGRPVLVPPFREASGPPRTASLLESSFSRRGSEAGAGDFQPSADFAASADSEATLAEARADLGLPWGVGSPRTGDSLPVFHYSAMPAIDVPKEWEYSLDSGDNIQSFSNAQQDVKLLTQVLSNITQGFFLDTNAGNGEHPSNTLLLEILGWRGLIMEPRGYQYLDLWSKMRKAWLFLGCISPHANATKIGFDTNGDIDMLSGHMIHAYNMKDFMAEMGGRTTIDFWNLHSGGYEAEILNETLLGVGSFLEFGVILVRFDGRRAGRGWQSFVQHRSKDETEEIIFEILHNASFKYIGGLDAYWINHVSPRYHYNDVVFVNPSYFEKRGIPTPTTIKAAPPPPIGYPGNIDGHEFYTGARRSANFPGADSWDSGFNRSEESKMVVSFIKKSKEAAASMEPPAKAVRAPSTKLVDYFDSPTTDA